MYGYFGAAVPSSGQFLQTLLVGSGGQFSGLSIANDETLLQRNDTYGGYVWNANAASPKGNNGATGAWQPVLKGSSFPLAQAINYLGGTALAQLGTFADVIAPSNSSVMYTVWPVYPLVSGQMNLGIFVSVNGGATWTLTPYNAINSSNAPSNDGYRLCGGKMIVHPSNPDVCFLGLQGTPGLIATKNGTSGASSTWSSPSGFPAGTSGPYISGLCFNPNAPANAFGWSKGNGGYLSANADQGDASTWTKITATGGPSTVGNADWSADGTKIYCTEGAQGIGGGKLWSYTVASNTWTTEIASTTLVGVACDPTAAAHVVAVDTNSNIYEHTAANGWRGPSSGTSFTSPSDVPWLIPLLTGINNLLFSRTTPNKVYANCSNNCFYFTANGSITTSSTINFTSQGVGEEQIVGNCIVCPSTGKPVLGGWDHGFIAISDLTKYPGPLISPFDNQNLTAVWSLDVARFTNTNFIAGISDGGIAAYGSFGHQASGWSTDGGATWNVFGSSGSTTLPSGVWTTSNTSGFSGGNIAVSSPSSMIWAPTGGHTPFYTTDGGVTWQSIVVSGSPSFTSFFPSGTNTVVQRYVFASISAAGTYYLYLPPNATLYKTTNGGANFSSVNSSCGFTTASLMDFWTEAPGNAGHIWANSNGALLGSAGSLYSFGQVPDVVGLYFNTTAGVGSFTQVTNASFSSFSFGAINPNGGTYPSIIGLGQVVYKCTDSVSIVGIGNTATFTLPAALSSQYAALAATYVSGAPIGVNPVGNSSQMTGIVTGYNPATGKVSFQVVTSSTAGGSGPFSSWALSVYGEWISDSGAVASPVWQWMGAAPQLNYFDTPKYVCGDPGVWGQFYTAWAGSGYAMRK